MAERCPPHHHPEQQKIQCGFEKLRRVERLCSAVEIGVAAGRIDDPDPVGCRHPVAAAAQETADSAESVYNRVVYDIGIPPEAFMATDVVVTLGTVRDRRTGHLIRRVNELVTTGGKPGEFVEVSDPEALFSSPVIRRAMQTSQSGRREAAKEIRARSILRAHLAEMGAVDERFLGPEWILAANDAVQSMRRDEPAEAVLERFRRRTEASR